MNSQLRCPRQYSLCKPGLELLGTIPEVRLGSSYMSGVGHRIFAAFRETVDTVWKLATLF